MVPPRVEANEIGAHHPFHQPVAIRKREENLRIRKRHVEEESNARVGNAIAQKCRHAQQLIVMHPNDIALAGNAATALAKRALTSSYTSHPSM